MPPRSVITDICEHYEISQSNLAKKLGISRQRLNGWHSRNSIPTPWLEPLAKVLKVAPSSILTLQLNAKDLYKTKNTKN